MSFPWKATAAIGGGLLLLLAFSGTSSAATPPKKTDPVPPPPPPGPKKGPHPPPWPGMTTATVRVAGNVGIVTHKDPSVTSPHLPNDGDTFNGSRVAVIEETTDASGRMWMHIYTPSGYEGWASSADPAGNRNIYYDDAAAPDQGEGGAVHPTGPRDTSEDITPERFAQMSGAPPGAEIGAGHGWYPYPSPASRMPPAARGRLAFRPRG